MSNLAGQTNVDLGARPVLANAAVVSWQLHVTRHLGLYDTARH